MNATEQTAHTPGQWSSGTMSMTPKNWAALRGRNLNIVRRGHDVIAVVWCGDDKEGEEEANSRLIAAAPDLLTELRRDLAYVMDIRRLLTATGMVETVQFQQTEMREEAIRAAIVKAGG